MAKRERKIKPNISRGSNEETVLVTQSFNSFAIDLYKQLEGNGDNIFFSPFSISIALAMTYIGAKGATAEEMGRMLHIQGDEEFLARGAATIIAEMHANEVQAKNQLNLANALWIQYDFPIEALFSEQIRGYYYGEIAAVNFTHVEATRAEINTWVSNQTQGTIPELLGPRSLSPLSVLVIVNAIYFLGKWSNPFSPKETRDQAFYLLDGGEIQVSLMHLQALFNYTEDDDGTVQYLEMPYVGEDLAMGVLLPTQRDGLPALEETLTIEQVTKLIQTCCQQKVNVFLPRFKLEGNFHLVPKLQQLGMVSATVKDRADFSGITPNPEGVFIGDVIHQAYVDVTEEGTEAAAATAILIPPSAAPGVRKPPVPIFRADHPFLFLIRNTCTGAFLFLGRYANPTT